ncbi:B-type flagellin [Planctomycetales bacterium]|nr:B-type flagellin [Planctomycetales bacterium]
MPIYFNPNAAELRSIIQFNRISLQLADSMRKLETGQRINAAKDDPSGLIIREPMRAEIKGIQAAQNNVKGASAVLDIADTGLSAITDIIRGEMEDDSGMSLLGIVMSTDMTSAEKKYAIADRLTLIDGVAGSAMYGNKRILNGSMAYFVNGVDSAKLNNVQVNSAGSGVQVNIKTSQAAAKGLLIVDNTAFFNVPGGRPVVGDTITVERQNGVSVQYTLKIGDVDDGKLTATAANRINTDLQNTGMAASFQNGNLVLETLNYGPDETITVTSGSSVIQNAVKNSAGSKATASTGSNAVMNVLGQGITANGNKLSYYGSNIQFSADITDAMRLTKGASTSFKVSGGASFNLGNNVGQNVINIGIKSADSSSLGGSSGTLRDLLSLDFDNAADAARAVNIVNETLGGLANERAKIGWTQNNVSRISDSLNRKLIDVTEAEAAISETDVTMESSQAARLELLAQSAMNAILFHRSFASYIAGSLL